MHIVFITILHLICLRFLFLKLFFAIALPALTPVLGRCIVFDISCSKDIYSFSIQLPSVFALNVFSQVNVWVYKNYGL
jgi:hypothetical protein